MLSVVSQCNSLNLIEIHGILQFALEQRSHTSFEQMRMSKALLALFARLDLCTDYPDEMKVVKQWMDDAVGFLYMKAKQVNMPPSKFIACNRELVGLVLPLNEVDVLVGHRSPWSEKQVEPLAVYLRGTTCHGHRDNLKGWGAMELDCSRNAKSVLSSLKKLQCSELYKITGVASQNVVLPLNEVDVLVGHRGPWSEKQVELVAVVSSSELGRMIFGFAIEQVMGSIVRADTEVAIQAMLDNNGVITEAMYNTAKMKCIESLEKKDGMAELSDKREVTILYRSAEFQVKVVSLMDEVEMRFASCLNSKALRTEELSPILCESDLVNDTGAGKKGQICQEILEPWQQARASCNDHLRATGQLDGPAVVTFLARKEAALRSVDPTFAIEMLFFSSMVGKGGEKLLQAQILELMPTRTTTMEAKSVLSSLKKLQCSELYKFTGVASQNVVVSVSQLIQHLEEGRQPSFASNPDPFMAEMKLAISHFCKHKQQDGTLLSGADAVIELAKGLKDLKKIRIEDLEMPVKFSWLLSPGLATEVETMRKQAFKEASSSIASVVAKAKRGGGAGSSSSSATQPSNVSLYGAGRAHDMARAFAHKCQFFFDLWLSKGIEAYDFTEGDYESYVEPAFFKDMEPFLHGRAGTRFRWLRELLLARMR